MTQKRIRIILALVAAGLLNACGQVKSTITVVDEEGDPIHGAEVLFSYVNFKDEENIIVKTDENGVAQSSGSAELRVNLRVTKEGYYDTRHHKSEGTSLRKDTNHDRKVLLRKIKAPTPLFARNIELRLPALEEKIGFDLKVADFVNPFGKGLVSDFFFVAEKNYTSSEIYSTRVNLLFENRHAGIQLDQNAQRGGKFFESQFKSSRLGRLDGYEKEASFVASKSAKDGYKGSTNPAAYLVRSRVVEDDGGEVISCHYSKLRNSIKVSRGAGLQASLPVIEFTYYFNPTPNDRNLEFDPEKNLFKNLPRNEQVREP